MSRWLSLVLLFALPVSLCAAPDRIPAKKAPQEEKGTYLGALFGPIPEVLYAHLPKLQKDRGVLLTYVVDGSPAAKAGLKRYDILLEYDGKQIRNSEQLANTIRSDKPDHLVKLVFFRAGERMTAKARLSLGPKLTVATTDQIVGSPAMKTEPPGIVKPPTQSAVSVVVKPLEGEQLRVTVQYYKEGTSTLRTVTCTGSSSEIETEFQKLPKRVQPLALAAYQRICERHLHKKISQTPQTPPPTSKPG
jgi:hypothetical protein